MDIPFVGKECEVPIFSDVHNFRVGVFAGNLHTTTSAYVPAKKSILCGTGDKPIVPKEDAYDKMMEDINADAVRAETAANKAEEKLADMQERYYTPNVSEDGDLSWEPNAEDMPAVPAVNIKGAPGEPGQPGDDGYSPSVNITPIDGGHRVTFTDANGTKTFDVMNGEPGEPGVNAENDELFVVRRVNTYSADKTYEEIVNAVAQRRAVMMIDGGAVFHYIKTGSDGIVFSRYYESTSNKYPGIWEDRATISRENVLNGKTFTPAKTPNPRKLILTGAVSAEYDGSEDVTVLIPEGGEGEGTGLPTGSEPHQMLVTDAEGKAKWEPKRLITGVEDENENITFSMPLSDMFALGDELANYDISICDSGRNRYRVNYCTAVTTAIYLYCSMIDPYDRLVTRTITLTETSAKFTKRTYISLYDLPVPEHQPNAYLGTDENGVYVLKEAPTGSASTPMLQMFDTDGVLAFVDMETGQTVVITLEMLIEMYADNMTNLRVIVVNANTGTEMSTFSFSYINMSEDPENPPYILFNNGDGKTIRMEMDGALSYVPSYIEETLLGGAW